MKEYHKHFVQNQSHNFRLGIRDIWNKNRNYYFLLNWHKRDKSTRWDLEFIIAHESEENIKIWQHYYQDASEFA